MVPAKRVALSGAAVLGLGFKGSGLVLRLELWGFGKGAGHVDPGGGEGPATQGASRYGPGDEAQSVMLTRQASLWVVGLGLKD